MILIVSITSAEDANDVLKFNWYDGMTPEKFNATMSTSTEHKYLIQQHSIYENTGGNVILQGTNFTSEYSSASAYVQSPGFVDTVLYSYKNYHNLIIRPDDVWTAVMIQFSTYVNANAEQLRHSFVNFEGKKNLQVKFVAPIDQIPIDVFIAKIVTLIKDNIDPAVSSWILPNFTTTTDNDRLTAGAAMMATLQKYFDYTMLGITCGIPELTIMGSVEDWRDIRKRVDRLIDFEVNGRNHMLKWSEMLGQILDEFVNLKEGKAKNAEFWKDAIRVNYGWVDLGCGGFNETTLNGWITVFSAFDREGRWQDDPFQIGPIIWQMDDLHKKKDNRWLTITTDQITPGVVQVPIKIVDEYAKLEESEYTGAIYTGHFGYCVQKDNLTLQPISGWTMAITSNPPEYIRNKITNGAF